MQKDHKTLGVTRIGRALNSNRLLKTLLGSPMPIQGNWKWGGVQPISLT